MVRRTAPTLFIPTHPEKIRGSVSDIVVKTTADLTLFEFLDTNINIIKWGKDDANRRSVGWWTRYINTAGEVVERVVTPNTIERKPQRKPNGRRTKQGSYQPTHPEKYKGDLAKIRFMSSWELNFHQFLDNNPNVLEWSSEEIKIPYLKPTTGRVHVYLPDYWVKYNDNQGKEIQMVVEVKPDKETKAPKLTGKNKKTQLYEQITWSINSAKWKAAHLYCKQRGYEFKIYTEKHLFR